MSGEWLLNPVRVERLKAKRETAAARARMEAAVAAAREAGCSWTQIGAALGVSAQAACKRFAKTVDRAQWVAPVGSSTRATLTH